MTGRWWDVVVVVVVVANGQRTLRARELYANFTRTSLEIGHVAPNTTYNDADTCCVSSTQMAHAARDHHVSPTNKDTMVLVWPGSGHRGGTRVQTDKVV